MSLQKGLVHLTERKNELGKGLLEKICLLFVLHEHLNDLILALHNALCKRNLGRGQRLFPRNEGKGRGGRESGDSSSFRVGCLCVHP